MIYAIENDLLRLAIDSQSISVVSLINKVNGEELIKVQTGDSLCRLFGLVTGESEKFEFRGGPAVQVREQSSPNPGLEIISDFTAAQSSETVQVAIRASLPAGQPQVIWDLTVANQSTACDVVEVFFPYLGGIYLGQDWQDDVLIYPHHAGDRICAPARELASQRYMSFWRAGTHLENDRWWREINYCGLASMMWMYYQDPQGGIYLGSHDHDFLVTGIRIETGGPDHPWMGFAFRKYNRILPGESWQSMPYVTAVSGQDWHWGAGIYRKWFQQHVQIHPNPEHLGKEYSLTPIYSLKRLNTVSNHFYQLPGFFKTGREWFGSRHLFISSWNTGGFDWNYPQYQPDMELGTPLDLYDACKEVNDQGGLVTFYINARIFDTKSDYYEPQGKPWAVKNEMGQPIFETYLNPRTFTVTCPAHHAWQKHIGDTSVWMAKAYGAKGIYLDQLGSAEPFPCYDRSHTHQNIGEFNQGYLQLLDDVRHRLSEIDRDTFLMIENCGDIFSAKIWGNLVWNGPLYDEYFNMFRYTFPQFQLVAMVNPRRNMDGEPKRQYFYKDMERAVLLGAVLWLAVDSYTQVEPEIFEYMRQVVRFRKALTPLLEHAIYLDDEDIQLEGEGVSASHWRLIDGRRLVIVGNINQCADASLSIDLPGKPTVSECGTVEDDSSNNCLNNPSPDVFKIRLPTSRLAYFVVHPG